MTRVRLNPSTQAAVNKALPRGISGEEAQAIVKKINASHGTAASKLKQLEALRDDTGVSLTRRAKRAIDRAIMDAISAQESKGWKPKSVGGRGASLGGGST